MAKPAELDSYERETAEATERTFTEKEAYALVADNVQRETAEAKSEIEQLKSEKAELQNKLDVSEAAAATEKSGREKAEQDLVDFKESIEAEKAMAARKDERVAKVREVAKHLKDEFFTAERASRWAALDDEAFDAYVKELAELSAGVTQTTDDDGAPRETAMQGTPVGKGKGSALASFLGVKSSPKEG